MDSDELFWESIGEGPALLFAHGFGGSARNFRAQARALRETHRTLLYDARGHARSPAPEDLRSYVREAFIADMGWVLDAAGEENAVVGGLSMGASVALNFALASPNRVRGLVLASYPPGPSAGAAGHAQAFATALERSGLEAAGREFVWGPSSGLLERDAALVRQGFMEHSAKGLARCLREYLAHLPEIDSLAEALQGLAIPSLIIAGGEDVASRRASEALAEALPHAELHVIEDAGHVVNLEAVVHFNEALRCFLESLAGKP